MNGSLYNDLGVYELATKEEILAKFEAHKQAFEVYKKAFEVLGDDKKKEEYDRKIAEERRRRSELYQAELEAERKKELEYRKSVLTESLRLLSQGEKKVTFKIEKGAAWKLAEAGWTLEYKRFFHADHRYYKYMLWIGNEDGACFKVTVQGEGASDDFRERNANVKKDGARKLITGVSDDTHWARGPSSFLKFNLTLLTDPKEVNEENVSPDEDTGSRVFRDVWQLS